MENPIKEVVLKALSDRDLNVVSCGIKLAGLFDCKEYSDKILPFLTNKNWQIRRSACDALGLLKEEKAKSLLVKILGGDMANLRQRVLSCASLSEKTGGKSSSEQGNQQGESEVWQVKKAAAIAISKISPEIAEEPLLQALKIENSQIVIAAMSGLANIESEKAAESITAFLDNEDNDIKKAAIICLGNLHVKSAASKLCGMLETEKAQIRREVIIALNHIKDSASIPAVMSRMKDQKREVRSVAAIFLGNTGNPSDEIIELLLKGLKDDEPEVRRASLDALSNLGVIEKIDDIAPLLDDPEEMVKRSAALALLKLTNLRERPRYT